VPTWPARPRPGGWQEWNADTLARARRENKLLFVSVGYFACHWCHVMQRESYQNPQIAALLNRDFIPVKVDRELNNGLDEALQDFSSLLNGVAGWPLNAFVTPEGYPVFVVLYAPPDDFRKLLPQLSARWASDPAHPAYGAAGGTAARAGPASAPLTAARSARAWQQFVAGAWQEADTLHGGFGQVGKFPQAPQMHACWRPAGNRTPGWRIPAPEHLSMAARGLRDHIGGGFFRYNTRIPDGHAAIRENALRQSASGVLYLRAATVLRQPRYRDIARSSSNSCRTNCWIRVVACTAAPGGGTPPAGRRHLSVGTR